MLTLMKAKGFGHKWLSWMEAIFTSAVVLQNGVPSKTFNCKRGVTYGDPLSPLLFVLAAHFLQSMINKAKNMGVIICMFFALEKTLNKCHKCLSAHYYLQHILMVGIIIIGNTMTQQASTHAKILKKTKQSRTLSSIVYIVTATDANELITN